MKVLVAGLCVGLALLPADAGARITGVTITAVEPFAEGATFGAVGAFERVTGLAPGVGGAPLGQTDRLRRDRRGRRHEQDLGVAALDGGHVLFLLYEMILRRKPSEKFLEGAQRVGTVLILALMAYVIVIKQVMKLF